MRIPPGKTDLYTAEGDNWCVVSWREGDTIAYAKTIVTDSTVATAHLDYSTANRDMGSKIIDTLLPTFQVDWASVSIAGNRKRR